MIELSKIEFRYPAAGGFKVSIPRLAVPTGECMAVVGPSGSGKTTLLGLLSGILKPSSGSLVMDGTDLARLDEGQRRRFRINNVGQVFQAFELLRYLSVIENIMLPRYIHGSATQTSAARDRAARLLSDVGLDARANAYPSELSQGEQQRVAVCRAMLNQPALLLADEPTGNLDQTNKQNVVDLLLEQAKANNSTLIMVTHDDSLLGAFSSVLDIQSLLADEPRREDLS